VRIIARNPIGRIRGGAVPAKAAKATKSKATGAKPRTMSTTHKEALAAGRVQGKAIGDYLDAISRNKPKRGRKRTADSVQRQLADVESKLGTASGTARVELIQRRRDLEVELAGMNASPDLSKLEAAFVKHAKAYAQRKGISKAAFREVGVPAEVLTKAGL
jgi:hypothetical protein